MGLFEKAIETYDAHASLVGKVDEGIVKCCYRKLQEILLSAITGRKPYCLVAVCYLSFCLCSDVVRQMCAKHFERLIQAN